MNESIEKFDAYHRVARSKPLSLQEANNQLGCNFTALSADVQKAYSEYKKHYLKIIMEENCAPGEPIQQRILSFKHFLNKQNLLKRGEQRKMVIGTHGNTQASRDINALRRLALDELKKEEKEFHQAAPLNLKSVDLKKVEKKKLENEQAVKKSNSTIESSTFLKHLKNITKTLSVEEKKIWNNSLYFVPKDEALKDFTSPTNVHDVVLRHAFNNKNEVVKKLEQWNLAFNNPSQQAMAKEISIKNRMNEDVKVGKIFFSLQSCKSLIKKVKQSESTRTAYFLPLVNNKLITI